MRRLPCWPCSSRSSTNMFVFLVCLVAALAGSSVTETEAVAVPVTVYYESLCGDTINFYMNQLYPTMQIANFPKNVDLQLVPYGKSSRVKSQDGSWLFTCTHGERECYGNKVHACALDLMTIQTEKLAYLNCLLTSMLADRTIVFPAEECAEKLKVTQIGKIIECANGTKGDDLLAIMGDRTDLLKPKLFFTPTIVFNNNYDQNDQDQSLKNFKGVLCKYISSPIPAECSGSSAGSTSFFVLFATLSLIFSQYFEFSES